MAWRAKCEDAMLNFLFRSTINLVSAGYVLGLVGLVGAFSLLWHFGRDLPDFRQLAEYEPPIVSRVYAADGRLIGEFAAEKRIFVAYDSIPKRVVNAFVAGEDQRFFSHPGIDLFGVARALRSNYMGVTGGRLQGGSTITQQVAKNFLLTPERSLDRKIKEMILSLRIESAFTKERILELYLNQIYLGHRTYGVAAAAQVYFNKALDELTIAEAAFLASLPQAPSRFDPQKKTKQAVARQAAHARAGRAGRRHRRADLPRFPARCASGRAGARFHASQGHRRGQSRRRLRILQARDRARYWQRPPPRCGHRHCQTGTLRDRQWRGHYLLDCSRGNPLLRACRPVAPVV
jgi:hypothetical protein